MFSIPFHVSDHENFDMDNPLINYIFLRHTANISSILKMQRKIKVISFQKPEIKLHHLQHGGTLCPHCNQYLP